MKLSAQWMLVTLLCVVWTSSATAHAEEDLSLSFGVYQTDKASVMYRQFTPVIKLLEQEVSTRIGRPVRIHMIIFKSYEEANDALISGDVDFVRFGPASYVIAKDRDPGISLLAMEHKDGEKRFGGVIVVQTNSTIRELSDLKGSRFAFGDEYSTIGRYLVQAELSLAGVRARDLADYAYLGRHDKVIKAVALGDYDAGAAKENTFKKLNLDGMLRVLHRFDNVTKPWVARSEMDSELTVHLRESLLSIKDPTALEALKFSGFLPTNDAEYQFVREGMQRAEGFLE